MNNSNFIEVYNELTYTIMVIWVLFINRIDQWSTLNTTIFIGIMTANNLVIMVVLPYSYLIYEHIETIRTRSLVLRRGRTRLILRRRRKRKKKLK
mmetsp:Transcript_12714/g.11281  ORF Transcript_12714/g.11281 Transcript_12714/m.11281 type:complete len:95 (+) Transcript_12714:293-577(+)